MREGAAVGFSRIQEITFMINRRTLLKVAGTGMTFALVSPSEIFAKTSGKHYVMVFDVRRCTGCISCTVSCTLENKTPVGRNRTDVVQVPVVDAKGNVKTLPLPHQCNQCDNPPCVAVCPVKATYKRPEDGIVVIDYDKCIHCQACTTACPYGARKKDPEMKNPPEKCNFCIHRLEAGLLPACVETCIGHARLIGDVNDPDSEVARILKKEKAYRLLASSGTNPNIYYIGLPQVDDKKLLNTSAVAWQR